MTDLFTTAEFKTHAGIPSGVTSHDTLIGELAADLTDMVDTELRRTLEQAAYQEVHDGTDADRFRIANPPIASSPAPVLYISGAQSWDAAHTVAAGTYTWEADTGLVVLLPSALNPDLYPQDTPTFQRGVQNLRIDYTGGYLAAARPKAVKRASLIWAVAIFNQRRSAGIGSRTVGGVTFSPGREGIPMQALALMAKHRMPFRTRSVGAP